jgi:uncharacterized DUF497 family protein
VSTKDLASPYIRLYLFVNFTWDSRKSARNRASRGFDFAFATLVFDGPTLERRDTRRDSGEVRRLAIGRADGVHLTVVYTDRIVAGTVVRRIISARLSNRRERQAYQDALEAATGD